MCQLTIRDNYFIESEYTEDGRFKVQIQELKGLNGTFTYTFKIIRQASGQQDSLIDDAIFWHEQIREDYVR